MELKEQIAEKILKLKLSKTNKGTQSQIQKLQQEYDALVNENQPAKKTK
jgi:hypothetical protein